MERYNKKQKIIGIALLGIAGIVALPTIAFAASSTNPFDMQSASSREQEIINQIFSQVNQIHVPQLPSNIQKNMNMDMNNGWSSSSSWSNESQSVSVNGTGNRSNININASGFNPHEKVDILVNGNKKSQITSDGGGNISSSFSLPTNANNIGDIKMVGRSSQKIDTWNMSAQ